MTEEDDKLYMEIYGTQPLETWATNDLEVGTITFMSGFVIMK